MNVTVIGGGNIGTAVAANISLINNVNVTLWTNKPDSFTKHLQIIDKEKEKEYISKTITITNSEKTAIEEAEVILCTVPAFARESFIIRMAEYISNKAIVGFIPGSGGVEFTCKKLLSSDVTIFGLQRVPYICRNVKYGKVCEIYSTKPRLYAAAIPSKKTQSICDLMSTFFMIPCEPLNHYMEVTLTPSNAILHTSRLYQMFKNYTPGRLYSSNPLFYVDWNDEASEILLECDNELQEICRFFKEMDLNGVVSLRSYYESDTPSQLTKKLSSIPAFVRGNIRFPMIECEPGKWEPDWESRYFTEDYPYGLAVIKGFAVIVDYPTPTIDKVLSWYQNCRKQYYYDNNMKKPGTHIGCCGAPQRYSYEQKSQIISLYN